MKQIGVGTFRATPRMRALVGEVLDTGRISYGPMSRAFEQQFAALHGCSYAVLSNSGTSSLQVALQTLKELYGWRDGDEVLVPALTFVATVNVVLHNGLKPVLVDVEPDYYGIDVLRLERAITPRTRAIVPVHLFGQPCNIVGVAATAARHDLRVVEDSCECMFVGQMGMSAGSWGDVGCFSTYVAHLLTTGVGGIATTNDPEVARIMRSLVNHGRDGIYIAIDDDQGKHGAALREVIERRFKFERIGHSFRITELEAALGLAQLETWEEMIATRQRNAAYLTASLAPLSDVLQLPAVRPFTQHAWMMMPLVCKVPGLKPKLTAYLEENGIETRDMLPLVSQPAYRELWNPDDYPVARWIDDNGLYIGCHQDLMVDDLDYVADVFTRFFRARGSLGYGTLRKAG
jgi:perosamine synthetase